MPPVSKTDRKANIDLSDRRLFGPLGKEMEDYYRWFKANPPVKIPLSIVHQGAGTEVQMPFTHLAACAPAYVIAARYLKEFGRRTGRKPKVLEVGCGTGIGAYYIKTQLVPEVEIHAIDLLPEAIDYAKKHYGGSGVKFLTGKETLPFRETTFDMVLSVHVLEHIPKREAERFVSEMRRVLKRGGIALIFTPNRELCQDLYIHNPSDDPAKRLVLSHEHEYYDDELRELFEKFFSEAQVNNQVNRPNRKLAMFGVGKLKPGQEAWGRLKLRWANFLRGVVPLWFSNWLGRRGGEMVMRLLGVSYEEIALANEYHHEKERVKADSFVVVASR